MIISHAISTGSCRFSVNKRPPRLVTVGRGNLRATMGCLTCASDLSKIIVGAGANITPQTGHNGFHIATIAYMTAQLFHSTNLWIFL